MVYVHLFKAISDVEVICEQTADRGGKSPGDKINSDAFEAFGLFREYLDSKLSDLRQDISEIKDKEDTLKLQRDIDRLGNSARKWGMRFQPVKCNMMQLTRKLLNKIQASYTLEFAVLENVDNIIYLGVTITNDLKWNTHISNISLKPIEHLVSLGELFFPAPKM